MYYNNNNNRPELSALAVHLGFYRFNDSVFYYSKSAFLKYFG